MAKIKEEPKQGPPEYMVSFCDMMTLILTFFILLVSMAEEQNYGLLARGLGSFIIAIKSHGMNGVMDAHEKQEVFDHMRRRFNLPEEPDPERRDTHADASELELVRAEAVRSLQPHGEIAQAAIAEFAIGSAELSDGARAYLDRLAPSLQPKYGQLLLLEGHALESARDGETDRFLAYRRAAAVREYLVEEHRFRPDRVEARAWFLEVVRSGRGAHSVDARLITPERKPSGR